MSFSLSRFSKQKIAGKFLLINYPYLHREIFGRHMSGIYPSWGFTSEVNAVSWSWPLPRRKPSLIFSLSAPLRGLLESKLQNRGATG